MKTWVILPDAGQAESKEDSAEAFAFQKEDGFGGRQEESDKKNRDGEMLNDFVNQGITNFHADIMFENIVSNYKMSKKLYGEKILRHITGYNPDYIDKNIKIPEFQRELKKKIEENIKDLKDKGIIDKEGDISDEGYELAGINLYMDELDKLVTNNFYLGEKFSKEKANVGESRDVRKYRNGDLFRNLNVKKTIKNAIIRGSGKIEAMDLAVSERESKGRIEIIYALDSSGSMKGQKLSLMKKAGVALAFTAIENKDKLGLVVFSDKVNEKVEPCLDFRRIVNEIVRIKAFRQTDITKAIEKSIELFSDRKVKKHLLIISDLEPTKGEVPIDETLEYVQKAMAHEISISLVGVDLNEEGEKLAKKIVDMSRGKLFVVKKPGEIDRIVLEDYYSI